MLAVKRPDVDISVSAIAELSPVNKPTSMSNMVDFVSVSDPLWLVSSSFARLDEGTDS